ncbi:MAG: hypothetical protein P1V35_00875 [Planctomycetota bacterium]|nr:hypothetical protein [Planctomycetota bacterium]
MDRSQQATRRLLAGLCIEQNLPDRKLVKRWQATVHDGEFDADACADEILEDVGDRVHSSSELLARAGGLQRDFLMMSLQTGARGAIRKAKRQGKGFLAYLFANVVAITAYSLILAAMAILLRQQNGVSYDNAIDGLVRFVTDLF